jgi:spore maturation protein CgeB
VSSFSILFIGREQGTSRHRALALKTLAQNLAVVDPVSFLPNGRFMAAWSWHTGALFLEGFIRRRILERIRHQEFDLVWVDGGSLIGPSLVLELKNRYGAVINYNVDDPYGHRDGRRWRLYLKTVPHYNLVAVVRDCNVSEAIARGARKVLRVHRCADEIAHSPRQISEEDRRQWNSEVAFVGTWMPERGPFMARLIELGVPLSIYGDRWTKAREWPLLRRYWRGPGLYVDDDYAKAIQCAKVNLGLLSKGNRDLVTQRSFEIPCLGGVLCAERTLEHAKLYREGEEAVFWDGPEECAAQCFRLLNDEGYRQRIMKGGRVRCLQNRTTNQSILPAILERSLRSEHRSTNDGEVLIGFSSSC